MKRKSIYDKQGPSSTDVALFAALMFVLTGLIGGAVLALI
jgi:hypothetical protein